ncbi:MAG: MarR family transcriptional regulator [Proteobacteria bacterium]|nr:MarR family transcriptional regulator [Pseudomonadota bacterium]
MTDPRQDLLKRSEELTAQLIGDPLIRSSRLFYAEVIRRLHARGRDHVKLSHTNMLAALDREHGTRATDLAEAMEITKQAVGQMVAETEALGWVERVPDPADGRAKIVRLTTAGVAAVVEGLEVFAELEAELKQRIGDEEFAALGRTTRAAIEALEAMSDA